MTARKAQAASLRRRSPRPSGTWWWRRTRSPPKLALCHPAQGRQRRRCRHCRADGAQCRRAAILGAGRRRVSPDLGSSHQDLAEHRRARDRAQSGDARAVPRCRRQAAAPSSKPSRADARSGSPACSQRSSSRTTNTASCHGPSCSHLLSSWPATDSRSPPPRRASRRVRSGELRARGPRLFLRPCRAPEA